MSSFKKADDYFKTADQGLQFILGKVKKLEALNQKVNPYLSAELAPHCQVANLSNQQLTMVAANGAIGAQLRFYSADLLNKFKQDPALATITHLHVKVRPSHATPLLANRERGSKKALKLTLATADIVREIAEGLEDEALKAALLRITQHVG